MIRVTKTEEQARTVITVDGQLSSDAIALVETCCHQAKSNGKPVQLFLHDVTTVDQAGHLLLTRLAATGVGLLGRGVYTSYLVQTITSADKSGGISRNHTGLGPTQGLRKIL